MKFLKVILFLVFFLGGASAWAQATTVKGVELKSQKRKALLKVQLDGNFKSIPQLSLTGKTISIIIPNSQVPETIKKSYSLISSGGMDSQVSAKQIAQKKTKIEVRLPFNIDKKRSHVNLLLKKDAIHLNFPLATRTRQLAVLPKREEVAPVKKTEVLAINKEVEKYDEKYLEKLIAKTVSKTKEDKNSVEKKAHPPKEKKDQVASQLSSNQPSQNQGFSLTAYILKFVAFLGLVLVLFYFVVNLLKKGVRRKGKLGFLNDTKSVEVLSTHYIAPKRSLQVVKVMDHVFLIGQSEMGMQYLTELSDVAEILKRGEKEISGSNFDSNLDRETISPKDFKLKDMIEKSEPQETPVIRKDKLTDKIKTRVKDLKPLQ